MDMSYTKDEEPVDLSNVFVQVEGYRDLARGWLPRLKGSSSRVLWVIYDQTVGFGHASRSLTIGYLQKKTGLSESTVHRAIRYLTDEKFIFRHARKDRASIFSVNLDKVSRSPAPKTKNSP
jgi:hypothetical protein